MDDAGTAEAIISRGLIGRRVTRVLLDYAVTLQLSSHGKPTIELKLETQFGLVKADRSRLTVKPGDLADAAREVAELHARTIAEVAILAAGELRLGLDDGRTIFAPPGDPYESWSYVSEDGGRVICMPSGGLAIWGPRSD